MVACTVEGCSRSHLPPPPQCFPPFVTRSALLAEMNKYNCHGKLFFFFWGGAHSVDKVMESLFKEITYSGNRSYCLLCWSCLIIQTLAQG